MALQEELEKQGNFLFKYRGILPLIIFSVGIYVFIESRLNFTFYMGSFYYRFYDLICLMVCFIGILIRAYTVGHTPKNTSGRNTENQLAEQLNTTGIYSLVRHPLYVGNFFMWLGIAMLTMNFWFIIAFMFLYCIYYERIMFAEEQFLRKKFGDIYLNWAEKTPAFLPDFKKFTKPNMPFSWKKVIKKEKNGILATFLIFYFFAFVENYIMHKTFLILDWSFFAFILSLIYYISVKFLSKKTIILNEEGR